MRPPGVYRAADDTSLLAEVVRQGDYAHQRHVLDIGCGTGALALHAAQAGARSVTAVDLSFRSTATTRLNALLHHTAIRVRRGDLFGPVQGERYDLLLANPPYVPTRTAGLPRHRIARCWDAGTDGRALIDRICNGSAHVLHHGGHALIVHSAVCDEDITLSQLEAQGMRARVVARTTLPFGPIMRARAQILEDRGLVENGCRAEEVVVVEAVRD